MLVVLQRPYFPHFYVLLILRIYIYCKVECRARAEYCIIIIIFKIKRFGYRETERLDSTPRHSTPSRHTGMSSINLKSYISDFTNSRDSKSSNAGAASPFKREGAGEPSTSSPTSASSGGGLLQHVTNTGAVVQLRQMTLSHGCRCYRVERRQNVHSDRAGSPAQAPYKRWWDSPAAGVAGGAGGGSAAGASMLLGGGGGGSAGVGGEEEEEASGWAVQPASLRTVLTRLVNMNDLFLLLVVFCIILQPLMMGTADTAAPPIPGGDGTPSSTRMPAGAEYLSEETLKGKSSTTPGPAFLRESFPSLRSVALIAIIPCIIVPLWHMYSAFTRIYIEEVVVVGGVGLQLLSYGIFNTVKSSTFVDASMVRSLVIHDAFFRFQPIFFLSASVENLPQRLVFFSNTLPRLEVLLIVLRGLRAVLYGEPEVGPSLAEMEDAMANAHKDSSEDDDSQNA